MQLKLVPDLFAILVNNPKQPLHARHYQKQKGPGTNDQPLFRLRNKFRKIPVLVMYFMYYLTKFDDVI